MSIYVLYCNRRLYCTQINCTHQFNCIVIETNVILILVSFRLCNTHVCLHSEVLWKGMVKFMDIGLALFVYRRPEHTRKVLESVKLNGFSKIYVFQDGLKDEIHRSEWEEVSKIIKSIDFAETELHISEHNKGLANSVVDGINHVIARHEAVIALEDDIVLGKGYLEFMDTCFEKYKKNPQVMCVCGASPGDYVTEGISSQYDVFFSYRMCSKAWGTWRDRWSLFHRNIDYIKNFLADEELSERVARIAGRDLIWMAQVLVNQPEKIDTWATYWSIIQATKSGVEVVPYKALAQDIGHDGSGTNSKDTTDRYNTVIHEKPKKVRLPDVVVVSQEIMHRTSILMENIKIMPTPSLDDLEKIEKNIVCANLHYKNFALDNAEFDRYIKNIDLLFPIFYHANTNDRYVRKIMEYYFTEKFLNFSMYSKDDIYIDAGCSTTPWVFYLREKRGINAFGLGLHVDNLPEEYKKWYYLGENVTRTTFPDNSVTGISMQSSFECLLKNGDMEFIKECARILRPGGKVVISPLYLTEKYISAVSMDKYHQHNKDEDQEEYVRFDCMGMRRANHYDIPHLKSRILDNAESMGMEYVIYILANCDVPAYDFPHCFSYMKFILVLTKK